MNLALSSTIRQFLSRENDIQLAGVVKFSTIDYHLHLLIKEDFLEAS